MAFDFSKPFTVFSFLQVPISTNDKEHNLGNSVVEQIRRQPRGTQHVPCLAETVKQEQMAHEAQQALALGMGGGGEL